MILMKPFFRKTPKAFNSIYMIMINNKFLSMINDIVFSILLQTCITFPSICVKHRTFLYHSLIINDNKVKILLEYNFLISYLLAVLKIQFISRRTAASCCFF